MLVARSSRGRSRLRLPRRLAGGGERWTTTAPRGGRRGAAGGRARPSGAGRRRALKLRQPLRRSSSRARPLAASASSEIRDELRVKEVEFGDGRGARARVKPNLPVLGPKLGRELGPCGPRSRRASSRSSEPAGFASPVDELGPDEVLVERRGRPGWAVAIGRRRTPSRSTPRSTTSSRRRARPRPHPPRERHAQGGRARADRPDRGHACRPTSPICSTSTRLDQGRGARRLDRGERRFRRAGDREGLTTPRGRNCPTPSSESRRARARGEARRGGGRPRPRART